jgi:hypothetical protein
MADSFKEESVLGICTLCIYPGQEVFFTPLDGSSRTPDPPSPARHFRESFGAARLKVVRPGIRRNAVRPDDDPDAPSDDPMTLSPSSYIAPGDDDARQEAQRAADLNFATVDSHAWAFRDDLAGPSRAGHEKFFRPGGGRHSSLRTPPRTIAGRAYRVR